MSFCHQKIFGISFEYLNNIGIMHRDRKLENFLLIGNVVKICDFGLVKETSGRKSYRKLGYTRRGSKYREEEALCKFLELNLLEVFFKFPEHPDLRDNCKLVEIKIQNMIIFHICFATG
mgnify:CR=1 FL=1